MFITPFEKVKRSNLVVNSINSEFSPSNSSYPSMGFDHNHLFWCRDFSILFKGPVVSSDYGKPRSNLETWSHSRFNHHEQHKEFHYNDIHQPDSNLVVREICCVGQKQIVSLSGSVPNPWNLFFISCVSVGAKKRYRYTPESMEN